VQAGERKPNRMKKRTKLTIETERVLVIRRGRAGREAVCEACQEVVQLLSVDEAATLTRVGARKIYRMVEAGKIHFTQTNEKLLLICFNSLFHSLLEADARSVNDSSNWEGETYEKDDSNWEGETYEKDE
jgi:excisionase family DNA binding protein